MLDIGDILSILKSRGMAPPEGREPIGKIGVAELKNALPEGIGTTGTGTTGLNTDTRLMRLYNINTVTEFLGKLGYGTYVEESYDCEDRAFWGVAHIRHKFPGFPAGVTSGMVGEERHAVIVLWYQGNKGLERVFWDPDPRKEDPLVDVSWISSIVAFPIGKGPANTPPITSGLENKAILYDQYRLVYRENDLWSYITSGSYDCREDHSVSDQTAFKDRWRGYDMALWAFAHVRRRYPGCPVGIVKGDKGKGESSSAIILFHYDGDREGGKLKPKYWDPRTNAENPSFKPNTIII